jgi:DNA-binding MurR/RpiR family transcriptional regulator
LVVGDELPEPAGTAVVERIRLHVGDMTPSERRIARALLAGPLTIGLESSSRLAERVGVSGPTVSRFAARLGFDNYAAFQAALREDVAARVMSPAEVFRRHVPRTGDDVLGVAAGTMGVAVEETLAGLSSADFGLAAGLLSEARHVLVVGGWFSHLLAGYLAAVLREFRPRVREVPPVAGERAAAIADVEKKDVVVAFDFRRYEQDTLEFSTAIHAAGARIVLFTDPWLSPIADIADAVLSARVVGPAPIESLTPTLAVVETLLTAVAERLGEAARHRIEHFGGIADRWVRPWPAADGVDDPGR